MKASRSLKVLDYLPPVVAFSAALVAIASDPKWNGQGVGIGKITSAGWMVIGIAFAALVTTLLVSLRNQREQASQRMLRTKIARTGQAKLLHAVQRVVCVFKQSRLWDKENPEPSSPLDLLSNERRTALASINLNGMSHYADGKGTVKWWEMFENTAIQGSLQITTTLQIYVTFFDAALIEATTRLLHCEFMHRLQHTHEIVDANTRGDPERPVRFFWVSPDKHMRSGYEEFWPLVAEVLQHCTGSEGGWERSEIEVLDYSRMKDNTLPTKR